MSDLYKQIENAVKCAMAAEVASKVQSQMAWVTANLLPLAKRADPNMTADQGMAGMLLAITVALDNADAQRVQYNELCAAHERVVGELEALRCRQHTQVTADMAVGSQLRRMAAHYVVVTDRTKDTTIVNMLDDKLREQRKQLSVLQEENRQLRAQTSEAKALAKAGASGVDDENQVVAKYTEMVEALKCMPMVGTVLDTKDHKEFMSGLWRVIRQAQRDSLVIQAINRSLTLG